MPQSEPLTCTFTASMPLTCGDAATSPPPPEKFRGRGGLTAGAVVSFFFEPTRFFVPKGVA